MIGFNAYQSKNVKITRFNLLTDENLRKAVINQF